MIPKVASSLVFSVAAFGAAWVVAGEPSSVLQPEAGEAKLEGDLAKAALAGLQQGFERQPAVRAKVTAEVEDELLGKKTEMGELVLKRPDWILRRYTKPSRKSESLRGTVGLTCSEAMKVVRERDFSAAPRALSLLRGMAMADLKVWGEYFEVSVFRRKAEGAKDQYRLVLTPRQDKPMTFIRDFQHLQARIEEGAPFYSEVDWVYRIGKGARKIERFTQITAEKELTEADFKDDLLDGPNRKKEPVEEMKEESGAKGEKP